MYTKEFRFETSFKWFILLQIVFFFQYRKKQLYFKENLWIDNQIVYSHL